MGFPGVTNRQQDIREAARRGLKEAFSEIPEFLARIGERRMIVFDDLLPHHYGRIFDSMMNEINERITGAVGVSDDLKASVIEDSLRVGEYGARDLKDVINDRIISPLANLRATEQMSHNTEAYVDIENGQVVFYEGKEVDEPDQPEQVIEAPKVPQTVTEFQYGQPFNVRLKDVPLGNAVNNLVHEVLLLNREFIVGKVNIFEARMKDLDEGVPHYLSPDARSYRIVVELNRVPQNFRTGISMQLDDKSLAGNLTTVRNEGKFNDLLITSWRDLNKGNNVPLTPIFSEKDLQNATFIIRK